MLHIDLFSGIGGFALAVDEVWPGTEHIFCEIDSYCQALLKKRFEGSVIYGDIRTLSRERLIADTDSRRQTEQKLETAGDKQCNRGFAPNPKSRQPRVEETWDGRKNISRGSEKNGTLSRERLIADTDFGRLEGAEKEGRNSEYVIRKDCFILTGGFPCQPFSQAGKRRGTDDNRYLWPEMLRVIRDFKPTWVIAENVRGILTIEGGMVFEQVCLDLEGEGYEVQPFVIPAVAKNAPHRRDRVWFVANRTSKRPIQCEHEERTRHQEGVFEGHRRSCKDSNAPDTGNEGLEGRSEQRERLLGQQDRDGSNERREWEQNWLEVATDFCGIYDGFSVWMDGHFDKIITGGWDGTGNEEMRVLFKAIQSPEIREAIGGLYEVEGEKVLLETVCQLQKRAGEQERIHLEGETVQEEKVRVLPEYEWIRRSSQERGYYEQLAWKLIDLVQKLSYETALEIVETGIVLWTAYSAFCSREVDAHGLKLSKSRHRVERLKALGNAIVPQVAIEIMRAIKQTGGE